MNKTSALFVCLLMAAAAASANGYIGFKAGTQWPQTLSKLDAIGQRNAWNLGFEWGGFSDKHIGVGGSFCGIWKRVSDDTLSGSFSDSAGGTITTTSGNHTITRAMFPLQFDLSIDPLPDLLVHPVIRCGGGPAAMIYTNRYRSDSLFDDEFTRTSGVYWGFIGRAGMDIMINIGKEARLLVGGEYQWSRLSNREWGTSNTYRQDMSGPSVYIGVRVK